MFTDTNSTGTAAQTAAEVLKPQGFAITFQNGIGNIETLQQVLGRERVLGGSSMCSAAMGGPGHSILTHVAVNTIGETDGSDSERLRTIKSLLESAGFTVKTDHAIMAKIWSKFVLNCCINALCATSGLRQGELARLPELDAFQSRIIDEVLAVTAAKGITLPDPDIRTAIKNQCWRKFSKPSMLQHVEAGKKTEIDALNGALVREAQALGIATPYNESLVALLKGRELHQQRAIHQPDLDYAAWEAQVSAEQPSS
jgi:2-dehydropantoate 2-reductase